MRIYLEVQSGSCPALRFGERFPLRVAPESSVLETRRRISERLSIPNYAVILGYDGFILEDGAGSLEEKGIGNNAVLELHLSDCSAYSSTKLDGLLGSSLLSFGSSCGISQIHGVPCFDTAAKAHLRQAPADCIGCAPSATYAEVIVTAEASPVVTGGGVVEIKDELSAQPVLVKSDQGLVKAKSARSVRKRNLLGRDPCRDISPHVTKTVEIVRC